MLIKGVPDDRAQVSFIFSGRTRHGGRLYSAWVVALGIKNRNRVLRNSRVPALADRRSDSFMELLEFPPRGTRHACSNRSTERISRGRFLSLRTKSNVCGNICGKRWSFFMVWVLESIDLYIYRLSGFSYICNPL